MAQARKSTLMNAISARTDSKRIATLSPLIIISINKMSEDPKARSKRTPKDNFFMVV